jgi:hypothetical protein
MTTIQIRALPATTLAEDKDEAARLRDEVVMPALARNEPVAFDFADVDTVTQSFVHALIAEAIRTTGERSFELMEFRNASTGVQHVVKTVFEYVVLASETASGPGKST